MAMLRMVGQHEFGMVRGLHADSFEALDIGSGGPLIQTTIYHDPCYGGSQKGACCFFGNLHFLTEVRTVGCRSVIGEPLVCQLSRMVSAKESARLLTALLWNTR